MANYYCKCGNRLNNSMVPNEVELRVYTDREWDDIINIGMMDSVDMQLLAWMYGGVQNVKEYMFLKIIRLSSITSYMT